MSDYGLHGFPDCVFYQYHFVGGPRDGEISNGFRPYFKLTVEGCIYEVLGMKDGNPPPQEEYVEWLDDGTRSIELHFGGLAEPTEESEETKEYWKKVMEFEETLADVLQEPNKPMKFYDPHPGLAGCMIPIPEEVWKVANKLANMPSATIAQAVAMIKEAYPSGKVKVSHDMISLWVEDGGYMHTWRVIRFKDL